MLSEIRNSINLIKRFSKEIAIALILAVVAAGVYEYVTDKIKASHLNNNKKAVATVLVYDKNGKPLAQGSGVFIDNKGTLVTNYHVIKESDQSKIAAKLSTGAFYFIKEVNGVNEELDIAILHFDAQDTPFVALGDSDKVGIGENVFAIGTPMGLESTVSEGVISQPKRKLEGFEGREFIQFTAPISSGSSGGGLFRGSGGLLGKDSGDVIGIVTQAVHDISNKRIVQQLNFAIPINTIKKFRKGHDLTFTEESPAYLYAQGTLARNKKDFDSAISYFKRCIAIDDKYVDAYLDLGDVYDEKGLYDEELEVLKKAVELDPNNPDAYYSLAQAFEKKGLYDSASLAFKKELEIKHDDKDAMYSLGILYLAQGKKDKAAQLVPKLSELNPGSGLLLKTLVNRTH